MLTEASAVAIGTIASGDPAAVAQAGGGASDPAPPADSPSAELEPGGVTVAGTVEDYRPVTDAMLRNPDDGDWLMIRRNYEAWSYSPLEDIDRNNVWRAGAGLDLGNERGRVERPLADCP